MNDESGSGWEYEYGMFLTSSPNIAGGMATADVCILTLHYRRIGSIAEDTHSRSHEWRLAWQRAISIVW
jgi:hypothetical protein